MKLAPDSLPFGYDFIPLFSIKILIKFDDSSHIVHVYILDICVYMCVVWYTHQKSLN